MNEQGKPGEASWRKPKRQMPARESGGGGSDSSDKEIHEKELGGEALPERRTLRGVETTGTTLEQRHPDWPKVHVTFYFAPHAIPSDTEHAREHMAGKDVWFFEARNVKQEVVDNFQRIADTDGYSSEELKEFMDHHGHEPDASYSQTFYEPLLKTLHQSGMVVGNVDARESDSPDLNDRIKPVAQYMEPSFEKTLENLERNRRELVFGQDEREEIITWRFEEEVGRILDEHPELKEKEQVEIFMTMGINHQERLHGKFAASGITTTKIVDGYEAYTDGQVRTDLLEGREPSKDQLAQLHLARLIELGTSFAGAISSDRHEYAERVAPHFTAEEVKLVHECIFAENSFEELNMLLYRKDLPYLPDTKERLDYALDMLRQDESDPANQD